MFGPKKTLQMRIIFYLVILLALSSPAQEDKASFPENKSIDEYVFLAGGWEKWISEKPTILITAKMSPVIKGILTTQQELANVILTTDSASSEHPSIIYLSEKLKYLKSQVPDGATAQGKSQHKERELVASGTYTGSANYTSTGSIGGDSYSGVGSINYNTSYKDYIHYFKEVTRSSSPQLVRAVQNVVHNTNLDDLQQRIDALKSYLKQWTERTKHMSTLGVSGVMRDANKKYLEALGNFIRDFEKLQSEQASAKKLIQQEKDNRQKLLLQWAEFEKNELQILNKYFEKNKRYAIRSEDGESFMLPGLPEDGSIILSCPIGSRTLFFDLSQGVSKLHPLKFIKL
jgi:hypothetical protein